MDNTGQTERSTTRKTRKTRKNGKLGMILEEKMVPIIGVEPTTFALRIIRTTF
ncbi:hypothetical protein CER63_002699 [Salmonella enterica subsp. enterica serovar Javiana]|nr:hypothetical protein [Salmonella enterica]EDR6065862.1 hypothetical protein [Salmonella enterica subsp. enterica serovar Javiana]EEA8625656.1 hypothetical protein [Salmonella enterica subsp. enterica]EDR8510947.1 hypothetical protein [Salmonella enterica]EDR9726152.1 hypothetical protein [Salmonella enterica subsp. enterica serovar Javiana]